MVGSDGVVARLGAPESAFWSLNVYPGAGEAGGCFVPSLRRGRGGGAGVTLDPERSAREAGRRARARLRRYCAANRLDRLGTLTYAGVGCHGPRQVRADVGSFFLELREVLGGGPFPYLWVPEWHKTHGLHLHFAVGQYVPRNLIVDAWGHGFVHIQQLSGVPAGSGQWGRSRRAAGYLAKYVAKGFEDSDTARRPKGLHRFDRAQGFTPVVLRLRGTSAADVTRQACQVMGAPVGRYWSSDEVEEWKGAPAIWMQWDGS